MLKLSHYDAIALLSEARLSNSDKRVFAAIASFGTRRPSRVRISAACGVHEVNVGRSVAKLVELGYLTCKTSGGFNTNQYGKGKLLDRSKTTPAKKPRTGAIRQGLNRSRFDTQAFRALEQEQSRSPLRIVK